MPCDSGGYGYDSGPCYECRSKEGANTELRKKLDLATAAACKFTSSLPEGVLTAFLKENPEVRRWLVEHVKVDENRILQLKKKVKSTKNKVSYYKKELKEVREFLTILKGQSSSRITKQRREAEKEETKLERYLKDNQSQLSKQEKLLKAESIIEKDLLKRQRALADSAPPARPRKKAKKK